MIARRIMVEIDQQARAEDENSEARIMASWDLTSILEKHEEAKGGILPSAKVVEAMVAMADRPLGGMVQG